MSIVYEHGVIQLQQLDTSAFISKMTSTKSFFFLNRENIKENRVRTNQYVAEFGVMTKNMDERTRLT